MCIQKHVKILHKRYPKCYLYKTKSHEINICNKNFIQRQWYIDHTSTLTIFWNKSFNELKALNDEKCDCLVVGLNSYM
jgi:hypothetical protein